jgi:hypothetical protein
MRVFLSSEEAMVERRHTGPGSSVRAEIAQIAASAGSIEHRAQALLAAVRDAMPYTAAWMAVRDPETGIHRPVGTDGDTHALEQYFSLPDADLELQQLGLNRRRPTVRARELPVPLEETLAWGQYLLPAGFRDGVALALFTEDGRHMGFLSLLTDDPARRTADYGATLDALRTTFARALDRVPSMLALAALTGDALGGVALTRRGGRLALAGLPDHDLLQPGSRVLDVVRGLLASSQRVSFLCPCPEGLRRVTALDCRDESADHLVAVVLVRPAGKLHGLDTTDLLLLGGALHDSAGEWWQQALRSGRLAARLSEMAERMRLPAGGAVVMHAAREGLYIPPALWDRPPG